MRFDSAREAGLTEDQVAQVTDDYPEHFQPGQVAALQLTDAMLNASAPSAELSATLSKHYTQEQIVELTLGVGLFLGMSKVLILLGLEPDTMPTTLVPTPGSR